MKILCLRWDGISATSSTHAVTIIQYGDGIVVANLSARYKVYNCLIDTAGLRFENASHCKSNPSKRWIDTVKF